MLRVGKNTRRAGLIAASVLGAGAAMLLVAMAVVPLLVPAAELRRVAAHALAGSTGQKVEILGEPSIRLLPSPRVVLGKVSFPLPAGQSLDAENVVTRLDLLQLLAGRVVVNDVIVEHPTLVLTGEGMAPALGIAPVLAATDRPELRIVDGTIAWRSSSGLTRELVSGITASLDRVLDRAGIAVAVQFDWREQPVNATLFIDDITAFMAGTPAPMRATVGTDGARARFHGRAALGKAPTMDGAVTADADSLRDLFDWAGMEAPTRSGFGPFSLASRLKLEQGEVALTEASLDLDGNRGDGGLLVKVSGPRPLIQGTFAADRITLAPYGTMRLTGGDRQGWDRGPLNLSALGACDLDLRLSAARVDVGDTALSTVAASAVLSGGRLVLAIGEAHGWGGLLRASLTLAPTAPDPAAIARRPSGAELQLEAEANDVELARALDDIGGFRRIEGTGTLQVDVTGAGRSIQDIATNLQGSAVLTAANGYLNGFDVAQLLQRIERRPLSAGSDWRGGRTAFADLNGRIAISDGVGTVEELAMRGPRAQIEMTGSLSIAQRSLDLAGHAALPAAKGAKTGAIDLPFSVRGPWDEPSIMADPLSLIERSGAALPLLEAVKARAAAGAERAMDGGAAPTDDRQQAPAN